MDASRFIMMNLGDKELKKPAELTVRPADRWIMSKCNNLVKDVTENMDKLNLVSHFPRYTTSCGMSSVTGTLRLQNTVSIMQRKIHRGQTMHYGH